MKPLVSILIPAYNSEEWIADTIQSAIAQTWQRKEIIVVDDGSSDRTAEVARRFASKEVSVVSTENQGAAAARNHALQLSQGDYIQWLDADDLLAPDKIERQLAALREATAQRILLSSPWAYFSYRTQPCTLRPDFPVARPFSCRVAPEEDGRKPAHANGNLADEPGTGRSRRTVGHTAYSVMTTANIFAVCF